MIRFMNLGATLSLNISDYTRGMKKAAEEAVKAEQAQKKLNDRADQLKEKSGDAAKKLRDQLRVTTEEIRIKTEGLEKAEEIERKYAARSLEIERQLSKDRQSEIRKNHTLTVKAAKQEYETLLRLAKQTKIDLSASDTDRLKGLKSEKTGVTSKLRAERLGASRLKLFLDSANKSGATATDEYRSTATQFARSQSEIGRLAQRESQLKAKILGIGMDEMNSKRLQELNEVISKSAQWMVSEHVDHWKNLQKAHVTKIQNEKTAYLQRNADKINQFRAQLNALQTTNADSAEEKEIVQAIKNLETQKDRYLARKNAELNRAANAFEKARKSSDEAEAGRPYPADFGRSNQAKYETYASRAGTSDQIGTKFLIGTAAIAGATGLAIKSGAEVSRVLLREFHSTSMTTEAEAQRMFDTIIKGALDTGKGIEDLAVSFRKIENIVGKENVFKVFEESLRASVATGSDLTEVAETVSKALNAFGGSAKDSARYANTLTKAAAMSSIEMAELAKVSGQAYGIAQAAGLGFIDSTAALVTFTKANLNANEAATQFRNSISKVMAPSKEVIKKLEEYNKVTPGIREAFSRESLKNNGLIFAFEKLREAAKATGQDYEKLAFEIFPNLRGTIAGTILVSEKGFQSFKKTTAELNRTFASGEDVIGEKFARTVGDASTQVDILSRSVEVLSSEVSKAATPTLKEWVGAARNGVKWFNDLSASQKSLLFDIAKYTVLTTGALGVGFKAISMYYGLRAAMLTAAEAQAAFNVSQGIGVSSISKLTGTLTLARLGWAGLAVAGIGAAIVAYNHFHKSAEDVKKDLEDNNKRQKESAEKAVLDATATYEKVKQVRLLVAELKNLAEKQGDAKKKEEERQGILQQIAKLMPDMISYHDALGKKIGLVADAQERLNKASSKSISDIETTERNRRANLIREAMDKQKTAVDRVSFLSGGKVGLGVKSNRDEIAKLFPGVVNSTSTLTNLVGAGGGDTAILDSVFKEEEKKVDALRKNIKEYNAAVVLATAEVTKLQKDLAEWEKKTAEAVKKGQAPPTGAGTTSSKKDDGPMTIEELKKMFARGEAYSVDQEMAKTSNLLSREKAEGERLFSIYRNFLVEKSSMMFGDDAVGRARAEAEIQKDPLVQSMRKGIVGKDRTQEIGMWVSKQKEILGRMKEVAEEIKKLKSKSELDDMAAGVSRDYQSRIMDLALRNGAKLPGEPEMSEVEKQTKWLKELVKAGEKQRRLDVLPKTQVDALLSSAEERDKLDLLDKVNRQQGELDALTANFFKKAGEGDGIYNQLQEFFRRSPELARNMGGDELVEKFIETTKNAWLAKEAMESQEDVVRKLKKAIQDTIKPFSDMDRIATDFSGGKFERFQSFVESIADPSVKIEIVALASALGMARKNAEGADKRFEKIDDSIAKARGELDLLTQSGDEFTSWLSKNFGAGKAPANLDDKLKELFNLTKTKGQLEQVLEKLKSLRKKAGEEDVYKLSPALARLREEEKHLARYESRLRAFENTYKQVFSRAFDSVLLEEGNFFKSLTEGVKQAGLRLLSQELANGAFDIFRGGAEKLFPSLRKPKFSKESQDLIDNPEAFIKTLRDVLFNQGNVMQVMIVNESGFPTSGPEGNPGEGSAKQGSVGGSGSRSNPYTWQNFAGAYALSRSSQGANIYGTGAMLKSLGSIKGMGSFGSSLGVAGGIISQVGLAVAVNDILGNPFGKLKKKIFGRATYGAMTPGRGYIVGENGPEFVSPTTASTASPLPEFSYGGAINVSGDLIVKNEADAGALGREFARSLRASQRLRSRLA